MFKKFIPVFAYFLLSLALMYPLLGPGYYLALDMVFGPNSFADFSFPDYYAFKPAPYGAYLPYRLVMGALSEAVPVEAVEKLLLFSILFLCGACMHHSLPEKLGASRYFGGLLYTLSPFVYIRFLAGHWSLLLSYALWPLAIKYFQEFLGKPQDRGALAKVALMTTLASVSSHGVFILLLAYSLLFIAHIWRSNARQLLVRRSVFLALLVLLMNLYWIAPTLLLFSDRYAPESVEDQLAEFSARGQGMPVPVSVLTMHGFWRGGFKYTKSVFEFWYVPFIIIAALCAFGAYVMRKDAILLPLLLLFAAAFLFALGDDGPLPWVFSLFESHLPLYFFFRDSQKFVGALSFVYAVLGAYGVHALSQRLSGKALVVFLAFSLSLPVVYNYGFFGFLGQIGTSAYPADWAEADAIIAADPAPSNILVLPLHFYIGSHWVNGTQTILGSPARAYFSKPAIVAHNLETSSVYRDVNDTTADYLRYLFKNRGAVNDTAELLLPLNIRYVLLMKGYDDSPKWLSLFHRKDALPDMELVYESKTLYLFRNNRAAGPFISTTDDGNGSFKDLINLSLADAYSPDVAYEKAGPASYKIIDSRYQYVVWGGTKSRFIRFDGEPASSWRQIGSSFPFSGPATVENSLFLPALGLLLLSWLICLVLLLDPSGPVVLLLLSAFLMVLFLGSNGTIGPRAMGSILIFSAIAAVFIRLLQLPESKQNIFKYALVSK